MSPLHVVGIALLCVLSNHLTRAETEEKIGGTINDLFTDEETVFSSEEYGILKEKLRQDMGDVQEVFDKVEKKLAKQLEIIREKGNDVIPITTFDKIKNNGGQLPEGIMEKLRKRGVLIVRNTIPANEISDMISSLLKYMYDNNVLPADKNKTVYEIYWSKAQMRARQHPHMSMVQKALLGAWRTSNDDVDVDLTNPAMYVDRLRMRPPGDSNFILPPHVDGGGVERWKDYNYRQVYRHILSGNFEKFDPFEMDYRVKANMNDFGYANGCTFFRAFQGWLSLGNSGPGRGTLRVLPLLKEATAYWMLRPFLPDVPEGVFPGAFPGKTFHISNRWHPKLHDELVSIPEVGPGDTVWWHADLIHSVESQHNGREHSSVFYIPAGPDCEINRDYLRRMRHTFVAGKSPPDFPVNDYEVDYTNRATLEDVTDIGRKSMGWPDNMEIRKETQDSCSSPQP